MKYINSRITWLCLFSTLFFTACTSFENAADTAEVQVVDVTIKVKSTVSGIESLDGLSLLFEDVKYGTKKEAVLTGNEITISGIAAGNHNVKITGKLVAPNGDIYLMSIKGPKANNFFFSHAKEVLELELTGMRECSLLFKEIFFAGTAPSYFRNQFYEIYNNSSDQVMYLDGIYFANLTPVTATTKLPLWPEEDGADYAYAERVWKFPGSGTDYPLQPGESCIISQFAANHKLPQYNPNSPVDCSSSEFEFNMDNPNFPNQPAVDMVHVFYDGEAVKGSIPQFLTSVFGGAYVMFKPFLGEEYDPVSNKSLRTPDLSVSSAKLYAKVPITYVLDAVEAGHNETKLNAKRVPAVLDAGMTYVGATYNSLGVARKKTGEHPNGTPILKDTNNSTEDFEHGIIPQLRRYNAKMPAWNHTLAGH